MLRRCWNITVIKCVCVVQVSGLSPSFHLLLLQGCNITGEYIWEHRLCCGIYAAHVKLCSFWNANKRVCLLQRLRKLPSGDAFHVHAVCWECLMCKNAPSRKACICVFLECLLVFPFLCTFWVIKAGGPNYALPVLSDQSGTVKAQRETRSPSLSVAFPPPPFCFCTTFDDLFLCISLQCLPGE